jgi:hypothetical protein
MEPVRILAALSEIQPKALSTKRRCCPRTFLCVPAPCAKRKPTRSVARKRVSQDESSCRRKPASPAAAARVRGLRTKARRLVWGFTSGVASNRIIPAQISEKGRGDLRPCLFVHRRKPERDRRGNSGPMKSPPQHSPHVSHTTNREWTDPWGIGRTRSVDCLGLPPGG